MTGPELRDRSRVERLIVGSLASGKRSVGPVDLD
jgi:hypothetical protein